LSSKASFLFIPDISGFTEFVNQTEIEHSQHIISELLELIIESNQLGLEISEVEGDAIFFYKFEEVPTLEEIIDQSRSTFVSFHNYIKKYETQRICNCGACSTAIDLKIKFVAHQGEFGFVKVRDYQKPHGYEVVVIHKLLKNQVQDTEYLLWTNGIGFQTSPPGGDFQWVKVADGFAEYEKLGRVDYRYLSLTPLYSELTEPIIGEGEKIKTPAVSRIKISKSPHFIFQFLIRFDLRYLWNKELKEIKYDDPINKVGAKHICVLDSGTLEIESIEGSKGESQLTYGEKVLNPPLIFSAFSTFFVIREEDGESEVELEIHYALRWFLRWLDPLLRKKMVNTATKILGYLKTGCEEYQGDLV